MTHREYYASGHGDGDPGVGHKEEDDDEDGAKSEAQVPDELVHDELVCSPEQVRERVSDWRLVVLGNVGEVDLLHLLLERRHDVIPLQGAV